MASTIAFCNVAGTPCTAYSSAGLMDQETADSYAHFLAWAALRRQLQEPVVVQECTTTFPRDQFVKILPMYDWSFAIVDPSRLGWPVKRPRQWCVWPSLNLELFY